MHLTADSIALRPADFYKEHDIELQLGKQVCKKNQITCRLGHISTWREREDVYMYWGPLC